MKLNDWVKGVGVSAGAGGQRLVEGPCGVWREVDRMQWWGVVSRLSFLLALLCNRGNPLIFSEAVC